MRLLILIGTAAIVSAGTTAGTHRLLDDRDDRDEPESESVVSAAETVTVERRTLIESTRVVGRIGFGTSVALPVDATGIVTWSPQPGDVVRSGEELIRIAERPVLLIRGQQPLYRELRLVPARERDAAGDRLGPQTGDDVRQLQDFLIESGFDDEGRLVADGTFGSGTERAVESWQKSVGHPATGRVDATQMIFEPGPVRIDTVDGRGRSFTEIKVTGTAPSVTLALDDDQRRFFATGTEVTVFVGDDRTTDGVVTDLVRETGDVGGDTGAANRADIELLTELEEEIESAAVESELVVAAEADAVPVRALIALAEGGWALQRPNPVVGLDPELARVELVVVVDGWAAIDGLEPGTDILVPA